MELFSLQPGQEESSSFTASPTSLPIKNSRVTKESLMFIRLEPHQITKPRSKALLSTLVNLGPCKIFTYKMGLKAAFQRLAGKM